MDPSTQSKVRKGGREGGRERGREGVREGGREGRRERGREGGGGYHVVCTLPDGPNESQTIYLRSCRKP